MNSQMPIAPPGGLRREAIEAPVSGIVEVFDYGRGRPDLIPLWAGEGDLPTPGFIIAAAEQSLRAGETFYTWQRGLPELRHSVSGYLARLHGKPVATDRLFVTVGGMHAIQIASRLVSGPGDEVLIPVPSWPNIVASVGIAGAKPVEVPLTFGERGWTLDPDRLFAAATPRTRAIFLNSPNNPTGWTATREELASILAFSRQRGLWIIADEVYGRFAFTGGIAPSFHDVSHPDDRILYVNTFSKNWAMTGWRVGWIEAPASLGQAIENLIQYSTSGVAAFVQRAAIAGVEQGESFVAAQIGRARAGREIMCNGLEATGRVRLVRPDGALYLFFAVDGIADTRRLALRLVVEANVGLAPGEAFGSIGRGYLRACFARGGESLQAATDRLSNWLRRM